MEEVPVDEASEAVLDPIVDASSGETQSKNASKKELKKEQQKEKKRLRKEEEKAKRAAGEASSQSQKSGAADDEDMDPTKTDGKKPDPHEFQAPMSITEYIHEYIEQNGARLKDEAKSLSGEITSNRSLSSKLFFYDLHVDGAKVQVVAYASISGMDDDEFSTFHSNVKRGDNVRISGFPGKARRGAKSDELSIFAESLEVLSHFPHMMPGQTAARGSENANVKMVITKPISEFGPEEADIQRSLELEKYLNDAGIYESKVEASKRKLVLREIREIVKKWVEQVARERGYPDQDANAVIFPFGSYELGVHGPHDDIDLLCVVPSYVNREEDFFSELHKILKGKEEVKELQPVPGARVPIMKFKYDGIAIDLLYARFLRPVVPDNLDISQVSDHAVDECTVPSFSGCRVADQILELVSNLNVEHFRTALSYLKFWARRRGIYSNMTGYLGGVHWAILVAHVCLLYPKANPSMLVALFFRVYTEWHWPNPVSLYQIEEAVSGYMPIMTPVHPFENSSPKVSTSTLHVMMEQFKSGDKICQKIELNEAQWSDLFEPFMFFQSYKDYLKVKVSAADADELRSWNGLVESRLRQLASAIERDTKGMLQCHIYPHQYVDMSKQCACTAFFIGLQAKEGEEVQEGHQSDIGRKVDEFRRSVCEDKSREPGMQIYVSRFRRSQIPSDLLRNQIHVPHFRRRQMIPSDLHGTSLFCLERERDEEEKEQDETDWPVTVQIQERMEGVDRLGIGETSYPCLLLFTERGRKIVY